MQEVDSDSIEIGSRNKFPLTAFLLVVGIALLATGFGMIALTILTGALNSTMLFLDSGVALFVLGIVSVVWAWRTLS